MKAMVCKTPLLISSEVKEKGIYRNLIDGVHCIEINPKNRDDLAIKLKLLLLILIHELIHNNLINKYEDTIELHKVIDKIYRNVINNLNLQDFEEAKKMYNEKYRGSNNH